MQRWQEAGAEGDPSQLRKLFLKQSLAPITASAVQVCAWAVRVCVCLCTYDCAC
jgi:hypothetical protein